MESSSDQRDTRIDSEKIDALGHVIRVGAASEGSPDFNSKIDVFSVEKEGDRAQIYQMWAVDRFTANHAAYEAAQKFGLAGDTADKEKWTQLLEHISGVLAIALHVDGLLEKNGVAVDASAVEAASIIDNLDKPLAIEAGSEMATDLPLDTAALVHDIEKPAEIAAAREMAAGESAGGLENSRDNPVLREGRLWSFLRDHGVDDQVILAAQNTGRSDRYFSDLENYEGDAVKKAVEDRESLAELMGVSRQEVDRMTPTERRRASIEGKGPLAAIVGISDALAAQARFKGMSDEAIDGMSQYYLTYKKDPESLLFFGRDWPAYYKEVRNYLIDLVPAENRDSFAEELDSLTEQQIFNQTILPNVLGPHAMGVSDRKRAAGEPNAHDRLQYPDA